MFCNLFYLSSYQIITTTKKIKIMTYFENINTDLINRSLLKKFYSEHYQNESGYPVEYTHISWNGMGCSQYCVNDYGNHFNCHSIDYDRSPVYINHLLSPLEQRYLESVGGVEIYE